MNAFVRTFVFAMALLGMLLVGGLLALVVLLGMDDTWRDAARRALLSDQEQRTLATAAARAQEPPRVAPPSEVDLERLTADLADRLGRGQINDLVEELRAKQNAVDDLRAHIEREEAELRLARADLLRVQRQIQESEARVEAERRDMQAEHERYVRMQAENLQAIKVLNEHERQRYRELAAIYEAMRNDAWLQLRQMEAEEIARILNFMAERRAANVLGIAARDMEYPGKSLAIHQALLRLDPDGATGSQIDRLAQLYSFMNADTVLTHVENSSSEEVAAILIAMDRPRLVADILQELRRRDDPRRLEVQRLLQKANVAGLEGGGQ